MKKTVYLIIFILIFNFAFIIPQAISPQLLAGSPGIQLDLRDSISRLAKGMAAIYLLNRLDSIFFNSGDSRDSEEDPSQDNETSENTANEKQGDDVKGGLSSATNSENTQRENPQETGRQQTNFLDDRSDVLAGKVIIIDAGHGGSDPGAVGPAGLQEKDMVLDIALKTYEILQKRTEASVYLTRTDDYFVSLGRRTTMANNLQADVFLSIHNNADIWGRKQGIETYAHFNATRPTWALAWYLHDSLVNRLQLNDRGMQANNFHVLRETYDMLSVLLEIGYISDYQDEIFLRNEKNRQEAAEAIYQGLINYYSSI